MLNYKIKFSYDTLPGYYDRVIHMSVYNGHKLPEIKLHCNKHLNLSEPSDKYMHNKKLETVIHKFVHDVCCAVALKSVHQYAKLGPSSPVCISHDMHNEFANISLTNILVVRSLLFVITIEVNQGLSFTSHLDKRQFSNG